MATTRFGGIRARDSDRADVCGVLDAALADGQLSADEHTTRTAAAMRAESFGELDDLIEDLQIPDDSADVPAVRADLRRPRLRQAPLALIAAAAVAGALLGGISRCAAGLSAPSEHVPPLTTGPGLAYFLAEYRARFGEMTADEVTLYPGYALIDRKSPDNGAHTTDYRYDGDFRASGTAERAPGTRAFDLGALDVPAVAALLAGAPQTLRSPDGEVTHVIVEFEMNGPVDLGPALEIYVKDKSGASGYLTVSFAGKPLRVSPPTR